MQAAPGEEVFAATWGEGRALPLAEAAALENTDTALQGQVDVVDLAVLLGPTHITS
jgi:hypothetical protein